MWIFTENGFVSIVKDAEREGYLLVRSRVRADVEWFVSACQELFKCKVPGGVRETLTTDYRFRASIPAAAIGELIGGLVAGIDYNNFKDRAHDNDPSHDRSDAYLNVWRAMWNLQFDRHAKDNASKKSKSKSAKSGKKSNVRQWRA